MDDRLERAFRSVRTLEDGQSPRADETLDRVLSNLAASKVRTIGRRRAVRAWLPAAAALAVSAVAAARLGSWTARTGPTPADCAPAVAAGSAHVPSSLGTAPLEVESSVPPAVDPPDEAVATRPMATLETPHDRSPAPSGGHTRARSTPPVAVSASPVTVASASARAQIRRSRRRRDVRRGSPPALRRRRPVGRALGVGRLPPPVPGRPVRPRGPLQPRHRSPQDGTNGRRARGAAAVRGRSLRDVSRGRSARHPALDPVVNHRPGALRAR